MKKISLLIFALFTLPVFVQGATFHFSSLQRIPRDGEGVVTVNVDTNGDKINTVRGEIGIPGGVEVGKILTGGSIIVLWVEQPTIVGNRVVFSGMTPGGFQGDKELFSFVVKPRTLYPLPFTLSSLEANKNDSDGTSAEVIAKTFVLKPIDGTGAGVVFDDTVPPEAFIPVLASDASVFDGKPFVSFVAQDKGVGIARYEWASSYLFAPDEGDWSPAESPLLLSKSLLWQKIYIRAIDAMGNTTVASVGSKQHYAVIWFGVILIVLVLCVLFSFARSSSYRSS